MLAVTLPTQHDAAAGVPLLDVDLEIDASSGVAEPVDAVAESSGAGGVENSATGASERPRRSGSTSGRHTGLGGRYWSAAPPRSSGAARRGRLTPGAAMASTGPGSGDEGGGSSPAGATVSGRRVFVYALRPIRRGEELTYDYSFSSAEKPVACRCGAANCRGTLNVQ